MADFKRIKTDALRLLKEGRAKFEQRRQRGDQVTVVVKDLRTGKITKSTGKGPPLEAIEHDLLYGDAEQLLRKHGYERELDAKVQALYAKLIPDSARLTEEKNGALKRLSSRNSATRLAASKYVNKQIRFAEPWLMHPDVVETIIKSLRKETDTKIANELIRTLGFIDGRGYADQRIFPELFPYFDSEQKTLKNAAVLATQSMPNREKWPSLIEMLEDTSAALLCGVLGHLSYKPPVKIKRQFQPLLLCLWRRKFRTDIRPPLMQAMLDTIDRKTVAEFRELLKPHPRVKSALAKHVVRATAGERLKFLQSQLLK